MFKKFVSLCVMLIAVALSSIAQTTSSRGEAGNVRIGGFSSHKVNVPFGFETTRQNHQSLKVQRPLLARKKAVPTVVGDGTTLYGEVTYSTLMDDQTNPEDARCTRQTLWSRPCRC